MKDIKITWKRNYGHKVFVLFAIGAFLALSISWGVTAKRSVTETTATPCLGPDFTPGFTNAPDFPVGSVPNSIAVGDFNGDGIPDLAIANRSPNNNVSIRLGNGSGGFTSPSTPQVAVGADPVSIAIGDFNGDGYADFITANQNSNNVSIRFGNGSGGFTLPAVPEIAVGNSPTFVAIADFNRDGIQDLVVNDAGAASSALREATVSGTRVTVFLGTGMGVVSQIGLSTTIPQTFDTLLRLNFILDINGDDLPDYIVPLGPPPSNLLESGGAVAILLGDGTGRFTSPPVPQVPFDYQVESVALADFNGDGKPDLLATGDAAGGRVSIRMGNGAGGFTPAAVPEVAVGAGSYLVKVADFNGDGKMDFATGNDSTVSIRLGNGLGGFTSPQVAEVPVGLIVGALTIGDFNNDGRPDFAAVINDPNGTSHVAVRLGNCTSTTATPTPTPTPSPTPTPTPTPVPGPTPVLDTGFDPNANGTVGVIVVQPDGKILIGGAFTTVAPNGGAAVTRNRIARFNPDGTLDTAFDPNANGQVAAIAVQADGRVLAGGLFTAIGGQTRNALARLNAVTGVPDSFDPNAAGSVSAIAVQSDGKILIGGNFQSINLQPRSRLARVNTDGTLDTVFDPNADDFLTSIVVQTDGQILVGGKFRTIGGQTRNSIARLNPATGTADAFNPNPSATVIAATSVSIIAVQADGKVLTGGFFNSIGGQPRINFARLNASTGTADAFNPNMSTTAVNSIAAEADARILAGGAANDPQNTGNRVARFNTDGTLTAFDLNPNNFVRAVAVQPNGSLLVSGAFTTIAGQPRNRIARFGGSLVSVSGRVTTPDGRGLRSAGVSITDSNGVIRTATTSSFGFYSFDNVATGGQYVIRVNSRLYRFASRTLQVTDTLINIDFVGLE